MPSEKPWLKASRCAAARSTRACHCSALLLSSAFGETLNCMSFLPLCCLPLGGGFDGCYAEYCSAIRRWRRLKLRRACHPTLRGGSACFFLLPQGEKEERATRSAPARRRSSRLH